MLAADLLRTLLLLAPSLETATTATAATSATICAYSIRVPPALSESISLRLLAMGLLVRRCTGNISQIQPGSGNDSVLRRLSGGQLDDVPSRSVLERNLRVGGARGNHRHVGVHEPNGAVGADEHHVERDERVLHPERHRAVDREDEDHPGVGRQRSPVHQTVLALLARPCHLEVQVGLGCVHDDDDGKRCGYEWAKQWLPPLFLPRCFPRRTSCVPTSTSLPTERRAQSPPPCACAPVPPPRFAPT